MVQDVDELFYNPLLPTKQNPEVSFLHLNYLGTPVIATNKDGAIAQSTHLDAWGNKDYTKIDDHVVTPTTRGYTNHQYDAHSNLTYAHARYLNTTTHLWLSQDPMAIEEFTSSKWLENPQAQNSYSYAVNNPVSNVDPDGRWVESAVDIALMAYDYNSLKSNVSQGNYKAATVDAFALIADVGGLIAPAGTGFGLGVRVVANGGDVKKVTATVKQGVEEVVANAAKNADEISKNKGAIQMTKDRLQHVVDRHAWNSKEKNVSKFLKGVDPVELINKAKDTAPVLQAKSGNLLRVVNAKYQVGVDRVSNLKTNIYTVVTKVEKGREVLITTFPGIVKKK